MMKRFTTLLTAVVFGGLVMQTGLVSAKDHSNRKNDSNKSQHSQQGMKVAKINKSDKKLVQSGSYSIGDKNVSDKMWRPAASVDGQGTRRPNLVQTKVEAWKHIGDSFGIGNGKSKHDKKKGQADLGPGRPDGRVETPDVVTMPPSGSEATLLLTTPPSRPGYVWNNGHWERAKSVVPATASGKSGRGSAIPYGSYGVAPPPVDRTGHTVKVTVTPGSQRDRTIYGTGPGLNDFLKLHDPRLLWEYRPGAGFTAPQFESRDHRTPSKKSK